MSARRRVVVTGMGMVTPVGKLARAPGGDARGRGGVGPITLFDASTFATRIAAEVKGFSLADYRTDAQRWRDHCRTTQFALGRRDDGHGARGISRHVHGGPAPVRRLPRLGRRAARFPVLRRPGASLDTRGRGRQGALHGPWARRCCTRPARPSRSRGRRPGTWRASSAPGATTPTA